MSIEPLPDESSGWRPDAAHLAGLAAAVVGTDLDGRIVYCNAAAAGLYGHPVEDLMGADLVTALFPEPNHGAVREIVGQVLEGVPWAEQLSVLTAGEVVRTVSVSISPLWREETVVGVLCIAEDLSSGGPGRESTHRTAERLARLARVTAELMLAEDMDTVTEVVISHAADAAGATVASLVRRDDDDRLSLLGQRGGAEGAASRWGKLSIHDATPISEAVRSGERVILTGRDEIHARYPQLKAGMTGERSMVCLPLRVAGRSIGAIGLTFPGRRAFDSAELEFLGLLAATCAQAMDRLRALAVADDHAGKLTFLANASVELASSLDHKATLRRVARLAVPSLADWCSVALVEDDELRVLEVAHADPAKVGFTESLQSLYPPDRNAPRGPWNVIRTGRGELIADITDEMLVANTRDEEHLRLSRKLGLRSMIVVPLTVRRRVLGVITLALTHQDRRYTRSDMAFAEDLARRAAVAIDNAQLHSEVQEVSVRLQRAVLPESLGPVPGWEFSGYYTPSGRTDVGGDFYDVIPLDGRVVLFVGDVMGRGVAAAAAMAQMRSAVRAYAAVDADPVAVMTHLDQMFERLDFAQMVTLVYALVDPATDTLELVNAGHLPPLLIRADGTAEHLPFADAAPLGVETGERTGRTVRFGPGDTFMAYTDGLIEQRAEHIDHGQARLAASAVALGPDALGHRLEELVAGVRDHSREDDIAVLVARRIPGAAPVVTDG